MILNLNGPLENQDQHRLKTYLNYLRALSYFTDDIEPQLENIVESTPFKKIQSKSSAQYDKCRLLLRNAWLTEFQFNLSSGNGDFIPYTIQWAAVQAYYAVYLHLRAYFTCKNSSVGNEHATTLKSLSAEITNRPQLYIELLRIQCANDTEGKFTFSPLPTNENPNSISTLTTPNKANKYDFLATMLKTTREKQLETRNISAVVKNQGGTKSPP